MNKRRRSTRGKLRSRIGAAVARVSWTYLIVLIAFWIVLRVWGDDWWVATLMLFGPLWVTALPLAVLAPVAILVSRRAILPLVLAAGIAFFLLLDVCVPWRPLFHWRRATDHLRLLTCNVHGKSLNGSDLGRLISDARPDIVLLQEAYVSWESVAPFAGGGIWHCRRDNELFVASRYPIEKSQDFGDDHWARWGGAALLYDIAAPGGTVHIFNIHLASPHLQFQGVIEQKTASVAELEGHLEVRAKQSEKLSEIALQQDGDIILGGDFNTVCSGSIYRASWARFADSFDAAGFGLGPTYFDEGAVVRIDHFMSGSRWRCRRCWVGPDVGSPHRPLLADLERIGASP